MSVVKLPPRGALVHPDLHLAGYVLLERIGHGGEAIVYSAWDMRREQVVAVKYLFIEDDLAKYSASIEREARILAELDHPNISPVYEFGKITNFTYLVMPYYPLGTLAKRIENGPFPADEILLIASQIAGAMGYIHAKNIIHRDLKPTNVMIDSQHIAYLADFGVAKPLVDSTRLLHTGHGTSGYAPPEQHTRAPVSAKADIYSFGVLLYQAFAGDLPWGGEISLAIKQLDAKEEIPDPREHDPGLPPGLAGVLRRLTAMNPDDRPATAAEAFALLAEVFGREADAFTPDRLAPAPDPAAELESQIFHDAVFLFQKARKQWESGQNDSHLTKTDFAFVESVYSKANDYAFDLDETDRQFLLGSAIANDFHQHQWWQILSGAQARWQVCERIILKGEEEAVERALSLLLGFSQGLDKPKALPISVVSRLVELAAGSDSDQLQMNTLAFLDETLAPASAWQPVCFSEEIDAQLGRLAREETPPGSIAGKLVARMRSETALRELWAGDLQNLSSILDVRQAAGSLPASLPLAVRLRVIAELAGRQLLAAPLQLLKAYFFAAAGSAAGLGFHIYATFRSPSFLDQNRILNTLGNALLFGPLIGLGIFIARWMVLRPKALSRPARLALGILTGALVIDFGFFSYHILFLNAPPVGWLIVFGALVMAAGVGFAAALLRSQWVRVALGTVTTVLAISIPWWLSQLTGLTPLLYYERNQPVQTGIYILVFSAIISLIAQNGELSSG